MRLKDASTRTEEVLSVHQLPVDLVLDKGRQNVREHEPANHQQHNHHHSYVGLLVSGSQVRVLDDPPTRSATSGTAGVAELGIGAPFGKQTLGGRAVATQIICNTGCLHRGHWTLVVRRSGLPNLARCQYIFGVRAARDARPAPVALRRAESLSSISEFHVHPGRRMMRPAVVVVRESGRLVHCRSRASQHHEKYDKACSRDDDRSHDDEWLCDTRATSPP